jgi:D-arabinose 1-dehydrogenase-like Zn-dependent alcohol dehydrogenase
MKAAVVEEIAKPLVVHHDWPDPQCEADEAIIRVEANGICRSDYYVWQGGWPWLGIALTAPFVLGHEYCGVVEQVGSAVTRIRAGDRVVAPFNHSCGRCEPCQAGHQNVCSDLRLPMLHYPGGFGRYTKVARADVNVVPLPESVSYVDAAALGCRFMTAWHGVVDQAAVQAGEWVAVFGCGGVGLAAVDICTALGANVIAVSRTAEKLALATELGAVHTVDASAGRSVEAVTEMTGGGAHVSVDALGDAETTIPAVLCLRARGRHLRLGTSSKKQGGTIPLPVDAFVFRELQFVGSFGMQAARYPEMLRMVDSRKLHPGKLVRGTVPIEQASDVLERMNSYSTVGMEVIAQW